MRYGDRYSPHTLTRLDDSASDKADSSQGAQTARRWTLSSWRLSHQATKSVDQKTNVASVKYWKMICGATASALSAPNSDHDRAITQPCKTLMLQSSQPSKTLRKAL